MTSTEKLLKREFNIKTEEELQDLIEKKSESFFKNNFLTDKASYLKMINRLIMRINDTGDSYSEYTAMAASGSILESAWTSAGVGAIKKQYVADRKRLVNHVRFFVK